MVSTASNQWADGDVGSMGALVGSMGAVRAVIDSMGAIVGSMGAIIGSMGAIIGLMRALVGSMGAIVGSIMSAIVDLIGRSVGGEQRLGPDGDGARRGATAMRLSPARDGKER
jgi:hypothetical protein